MNTSKKPIVTRLLTDKYLDECDQRAHNADPLHFDVVITDLRERMNKLTNHIRKLQKAIKENV